MSELSDPGENMRDVTPSDTTSVNCRALLVTVAGNLTIVTRGGSTPTAFPVVAGQLVPIRTAKVMAATTAVVKAID
jgi:hypothetical protein